MSANDRPIEFFYNSLLELLPELASDFPAKPKQQYARGASIEAMGGPHVLANLVAQNLNRKARFVAIDFRTVDEQAGRLVDCDQMLVAVENGEFFSQKNAALRRLAFPYR